MKRCAFTLVELLVASALVLFIMVIMSMAFVAGLDSFRELKAIGDLEEKLRVATTQIRKDLSADHFEGKRRLSDPNFWTQPVREGFFQLIQRTGSQDEGADIAGVHSYRATTHILHMAVKLRGNQQEKFFTSAVPAGSPLMSVPTNFFNQPADGRFQDPSNTSYNTPWAEVMYFLVATGTNAGSTPLFSLYRSQLLVVPDNRGLNWPATPVAGVLPIPSTMASQYAGFSCEPQTVNGSPILYFNNPNDLAKVPPSANAFLRGMNTPDATRASVLMTDVLSFDVRVLKYQLNPPVGTPNLAMDFSDLQSSGGEMFDTAAPTAPTTAYVIKALEITCRVWDAKGERARQVTIIQDM